MDKLTKKQKKEMWKEKKQKYNKYLKSKKWQTIRKLKLEQENYKCAFCKCKRKKLHIHHLTYTHLYNEGKHLDDLVVLCENCHNKLHKTKGHKTISKIFLEQRRGV